MRAVRLAMMAFFAVLWLASGGAARAEGTAEATIPQDARLTPAALAEILKGRPPTIFQVGSSVLFAEAHIPGAQYAGPTGTEDGLKNLADHVKALPHDQLVVIYCGCCPWIRCPNIAPAYTQLHAMGFTNVKALYLPNNFGDDWVSKGYPVARGS